MRRFLLSVLVFILILALTIVSTILWVNGNNTQSRLQDLETKMAVIAPLLNVESNNNTDSEDTSAQLPDFSQFTTTSCNSASEDGKFVVFSPCDGSTISKEFTMFGMAQGFFENTVNYYVDFNNVVVDSGFVTYVPSSDIGSAGLFSKELDLSNLDSGDVAKLEFYYQSPRDGEQITLVSIDLEIE